MANPISSILLAPIHLYQKHISPGLPARCRYYPTCSAYAVSALQIHGPIKGFLLATWRLMRCNPWSRGGVDHVPPKGQWRAPEWVPPEDWAGHDIEEDIILKSRSGVRRNSKTIPSKADSGRKVEGVSPELVLKGDEGRGDEASPQHKES
ncbi:membrane protein insertion efficiency factor YidD [Actinomycetaceae bacterium MB13-C1-2]|nr:membrane protein insertion efficiency factor YidD [Actinomycetaceae bacterium MB13-C1-2]